MMKRKDVNKKGNVMPNWRIHEKISRKSSYYSNYKMWEQKQSTSTGKRPDFYGVSKINSRERIVGDSKYTTRGSKKHVRQIQKYKQHPFYANIGVLHYPLNTHISDDFRKFATEKNVIITRTRMMKVKERQPGLIGIFKPKAYLR